MSALLLEAVLPADTSIMPLLRRMVFMLRLRQSERRHSIWKLRGWWLENKTEMVKQLLVTAAGGISGGS